MPCFRHCQERGLQGDVDGDGNPRMYAVEQIVAVVDVVDIDIVGAVPGRRPCFRAGINHTEPQAPELKTGATFDHYDGNIVNAKPVSAAKMSTEAIFRNAVSVITAALVPGAMLKAPIVCPLALPDVLPHIAWSRLGPSHLTQLRRCVSVTGLMRGNSLDRMGSAKFLVPLFRHVSLVLAVLRLRLVRAFVLLSATLPRVGTTFVISGLAVLCAGKHRCSQQQSQYERI